MAEWSKALVLGTSPKGRGFESHRCQNFFINFDVILIIIKGVFLYHVWIKILFRIAFAALYIFLSV